MAEGERFEPEGGRDGEMTGEKASHIAGFAGMPSPEEQAPPEHVAVEQQGYAADILGTDEDIDRHGQRAPGDS